MAMRKERRQVRSGQICPLLRAGTLTLIVAALRRLGFLLGDSRRTLIKDVTVIKDVIGARLHACRSITIALQRQRNSESRP